MSWYYVEKLTRAGINVFLLICAREVLSGTEFYFWITSLAIFYTCLALSSLGSDSIVFGAVQKGVCTTQSLSVLIRYRLLASTLSVGVFVYVCTSIYEVKNVAILVFMSAAIVLKSFDVYEYSALSGGRKKESLYRSLFFVAFVFGAFRLTSFSVSIELAALMLALEALFAGGLSYWSQRNEWPVIGGGDLLTRNGFIFLLMNSVLAISFTRADQFIGGLFMSSVMIADYFYLTRLCEPFLTAVQIYYTKKISGLSNGVSLDVSKEGIFMLLVWIVYFYFIYLFLGFFQDGLGDGILGVVSLLYLFNALRVVTGKLLIAQGVRKGLVVRMVVGWSVLLLGCTIANPENIEFLWVFLISYIALVLVSITRVKFI